MQPVKLSTQAGINTSDFNQVPQRHVETDRQQHRTLQSPIDFALLHPLQRLLRYPTHRRQLFKGYPLLRTALL
ncbi:MAG: hypothetical protein A2W31_05110 [Planctomycetes bacterium RBG_16_64_10]|nr:MAG: hypothetical protein A2W31_05110 [Planctomycetes bacterium RBG_16_64_10]